MENSNEKSKCKCICKECCSQLGGHITEPQSPTPNLTPESTEMDEWQKHL
jgi:hypothetical protein